MSLPIHVRVRIYPVTLLVTQHGVTADQGALLTSAGEVLTAIDIAIVAALVALVLALAPQGRSVVELRALKPAFDQ